MGKKGIKQNKEQLKCQIAERKAIIQIKACKER